MSRPARARRSPACATCRISVPVPYQPRPATAMLSPDVTRGTNTLSSLAMLLVFRMVRELFAGPRGSLVESDERLVQSYEQLVPVARAHTLAGTRAWLRNAERV